MSREPLSTNFKRRWYQFSLRSLLLFVTLCAIPCSWLAVKIERGKQQRAAVAAVKAKGFGVGYDYQVDQDGNRPEGTVVIPPPWICSWFGEDTFATVVEVHIADVAWSGSLGHSIRYYSGATYEDIRPLAALKRMKFLDLTGAQIDGSALKQLTELSDLERLDLCCTKITDVGLGLLKAFPKLRVLNLSNTTVGDDGMTQLLCLENLEELDLTQTNVTDRGLLVLQNLAALKRLVLVHDILTVMSFGTEHIREEARYTTETGVAKLQEALPNCKIQR